ncbi:hypothetical protein LWE61_10475 [Sphingobium sufflavum]|uniref:hypothetical protein n=1 Tax=Sphingobium sufflavum TaxID=1129547 RepID=UPI001F411106|nr:hypothetical protein [Sphingobium sufflavum]MCE7796983.1 hypothetical protein [Sphingobium sufflavum]
MRFRICLPPVLSVTVLLVTGLFAAGLMAPDLIASGAAAPGGAAEAVMALDGQLLVEAVDPAAEGDRRTVRAAAEVRSGDRLIFLIRYRNRGEAVLPGYDFVAPVPHGVRILPDRGDMVRVSVDGGRNWSRPDSPLRPDAQGRLRSADALRLTHVRLRLDRRIAPGEAGTVAYRGLLL